MPSRTARSRTWIAAVVSVASMTTTCSFPATESPPGGPGEPTQAGGPFAVAFLQDLSRPDAGDRVLPALRGAELAFATAALDAEDPVTVELVPFDLAAEPGATEKVAADPAFVAAIVGPDVGDLHPIIEELAGAGVPVLGLSALGGGIDVPGATWRRLVTPLDAQARVLARLADGLRSSAAGVCVLREDPSPDRLGRRVVRALTSPRVTPSAGSCGTVVWTGSAAAGAETLALAPGTPAIGGDRLLDPAFLEAAGATADGVLATCPCVDLSTSTDIAARRFIQDYQSDYGLAPGPYAVEAWDAAHLILQALRGSEASRENVLTALGDITVFEGLGGTYGFGPAGEPADPEGSVRVYRVEGGRWVPV